MARYRDEHEAAVQRAAALERELARAKRELADKDAQLAERGRTLDDREQALADERRRLAETREQLERAAGERDAEAGEARDELARLRDTAAKKRRDARAALDREAARVVGELPDADDEARAARRRIWIATLWHGELVVSWFPLYILVPMVFAGFYLTAIVTQMHVPTWVLVAGAATPWTAAFALPAAYLPLKLRYMRRWARTRPYELIGYPEILATMPPRRDEATLVVRLSFTGETPHDLAEIVHGFDDGLHVSGTSLSRPWPVRVTRSKSGTRRDNSETNFPVHRWLRRFERIVLRPLHAAHGLERVVVDRRG